MSFRISKPSPLTSESPEALFRDQRTRKIQGLLSHQADILREYTEGAIDKPDVAFQLPTGSGKTLVGLLLGEWRRRKFSERVVYLCPTNQLVNQVAEQANGTYGLRVLAFTGPKSDYDPADKHDYMNADAVAVTSYSALFNTRPFFENPNIVILDDAHAAENYIADLWSLRVERFNDDHGGLFAALAGLLRPHVSLTDYHRLAAEEDSIWDRTWVDKLPTPVFAQLVPEITNTIDAFAGNSDLIFPWGLIKDHLSACHLYYSSREILLRPLIPPTHTHGPFTNAYQRVYMSATLGEGGDLERVTGRDKIHRLKVPQGWDRQGIGRRMFMLPERSLSDAELDELQMGMIRMTGRALILCPDDRSARQIRELIADQLGCPTFDAREIERSKAPFISEAMAAAVIANRYDGIDFPHDECRLLIVDGLPRATNLQERFIITRMGAVALLSDRILTRLGQAFGRCTRAATDYAAVVIRGEELNKFIMTRERRRFLHPEIQAELEFGIDQSRDRTLDEFLESLHLFLGQGKEWAEADEAILSLREGFSQQPLPGSADLRAAVSREIEYETALWRGDHVAALEATRKVLAELKDPELIGYRALWYYLAGSAAWLAFKDGVANLEAIARSYFGDALSATGTIRWLVGLSRSKLTDAEKVAESTAQSQTMALLERLEMVLEQLGTMQDQKYATEEAAVIEGIHASESSRFERAHARLGHLLGFESGTTDDSGAPDAWWIVDENLCLIFEDHSDAADDARLHVNKARQAATHPNWARANLPLSETATIVPVLISPAASADPVAIPHLRDVFFWPIDEFRKWALAALSAVRELRVVYPGSGDLYWRATAMQSYKDNRIAPHLLAQDLTASSAAEKLSDHK